MKFYDLHMHSCLSPCGDELMTPNNIVNMAKLKGLDLISVSDHNSMKQQKSLINCAKKVKLDYLIGVELQTKEEVHVLAYFSDQNVIDVFQDWIDCHLVKMKNKPDFFGHQLILDELDEVVDEEEWLLINSLDTDLEATIQAIHEHHGIVVLAHVMNKMNGIMTQLGFIPPGLDYDGVEVTDLSHVALVKERNPWISCDLWLCNSDAHQLIDIHENEYTISSDEERKLGGQKS